MNKNKSNGNIFMKIMLIALACGLAIILIGHFLDKIGKSGNPMSTEQYVKENNITGKEADLMIEASKSSALENESDSIDYYTISLRETTELQLAVQRVTMIHFDLMKNDSKEYKETALEELDDIQAQFQGVIDTMGGVVPPYGNEEQHNLYLESMAEAIVALEDYKEDVKKGNIGIQSNTNIDKLKMIFSRIQGDSTNQLNH